MKLARKVTGRTQYHRLHQRLPRHDHGRAVADRQYRQARRSGGGSLADVTHMPFEGAFGDDTIRWPAREMLDNPSSGIDAPAAFIFEPMQGEGGLNAASDEWMQRRCPHRQEAWRTADRRRHPGGLRPYRHLLSLRGGGHRARHGHPGEIAVGLWPAVCGTADASPSTTSGSPPSTTAPSVATPMPSSRPASHREVLVRRRLRERLADKAVLI